MKNIAELVKGGVVSKLQSSNSECAHDELANIFNSFYSQLIILFPASSVTLKDEQSGRLFKQQWMQAFRENGIIKIEYIRAGMMVARRQDTDFLPSVGKFISWCKQGLSEQFGLPTSDDLIDMVMNYCAEKGIISAEEYPFKNHACYWLVTGLYMDMNDKNLSKKELTELAKIRLNEMLTKLLSGYSIPEPIKQISKTATNIPLSRSESLARLRKIKSELGLSNGDTQATRAAP